jgi:hypothetical protein
MLLRPGMGLTLPPLKYILGRLTQGVRYDAIRVSATPIIYDSN